MISPLVIRDHSTSTSGRDFENYKDPYATWLSFLHKFHEHPDLAVSQIMSHTRRNKHGYYAAEVLGDFSLDDFYLGGLTAKQRVVNNVYCRNKKVGSLKDNRRCKGFLVTEYKNLQHDAWVSHFRGNLGRFVTGLGMAQDYSNMLESREQYDERAGMRENGTAEVLVTPGDDIPI